MKNKQQIQFVLKAIAAIFGVIAIVLYTAPFATTSFTSASGFQIVFDFEKNYVKSFIWPLVNFILVVLIVIYLILCFIGELRVSLGNEKAIKNLEYLKKSIPLEKQKQNALVSLIFTISAGLFVLILDLCTLTTTGLSSNSYIHLGNGAIWSGLLILTSTILESIAEYLPYASLQVQNANFQNNTNLVNKNNQCVITPEPSAEKSIEEKLIELNSLKEKGLITEEEYQAKRKQILGL